MRPDAEEYLPWRSEGKYHAEFPEWVNALSEPERGPLNGVSNATNRDTRKELQKFLQWRVWQEFWDGVTHRSLYYLMLNKMCWGNLDPIRNYCIDQDIKNYLDHVDDFWAHLGEDGSSTPENVIDAIDTVTLTELEGLIPQKQPDAIARAFDNGAFGMLRAEHRSSLRELISSRDLPIPTLHTLYEDFKFWLVPLRFLKRSIEPREDGRSHRQKETLNKLWRRSSESQWNSYMLYALAHVTEFDRGAVKADPGRKSTLKEDRITPDTRSALIRFRDFIDSSRTEVLEPQPDHRTHADSKLDELAAKWRYGKPFESVYWQVRYMYSAGKIGAEFDAWLPAHRAQSQFQLFRRAPANMDAERSVYSPLVDMALEEAVSIPVVDMALDEAASIPADSNVGRESSLELCDGSDHVAMVDQTRQVSSKPLPDPPYTIWRSEFNEPEVHASKDTLGQRLKDLDNDYMWSYKNFQKNVTLTDILLDLEQLSRLPVIYAYKRS